MARPKTLLADLLKPLAPQVRAARRAAVPTVPLAASPPDDTRCFAEAMRDVTPLAHRPSVVHRPAPPPASPVQRWQDEARVMHDAMSDFWPWDSLESGEELLYLRPGQRLDTLRKLRRGHWVVQSELDLHGHTSDAARAAVGRFLYEAAHAGIGCVRIIHGKGLRSKNREPVLKNKLRNWLVQRDEVLAFAQARPVDGGAGAVLVLLKRR